MTISVDKKLEKLVDNKHPKSFKTKYANEAHWDQLKPLDVEKVLMLSTLYSNSS